MSVNTIVHVYRPAIIHLHATKINIKPCNSATLIAFRCDTTKKQQDLAAAATAAAAAAGAAGLAGAAGAAAAGRSKGVAVSRVEGGG